MRRRIVQRTARLAIALAAMPVVVAAAAGPVPKDAAATVNGTLIPRKALADVVQAAAAQGDDPSDAKTKAELRKQALDTLIAFELLYQESQARQLNVSDAAVADAIRSTESRFSSPKEYANALKTKGLTRQDIERDTRRALAVDRLLDDAVWKKVKIDDQAVRAFYDENQEQFRHPPEIRASHILIRVPPKASAADKAQARAKAEDLVRRAKAGEDFAALARNNSGDIVTAERGGDLGYFSRGTMVRAFEDVAFALQPGEISGVVESPFGFHVIKLVDRRDGAISPLEEVSSRITAVLTQERRQQLQDELVDQLRQKATIEIAPDLR